MRKNICHILAVLLLGLLLGWSCPVDAARSEVEEELQALQSQFAVLKKNNGELKCILIRQDKELESVKQSLTITSEELKNAREYSIAFEKEQRQKLRTAKLRTNVAVTGIILMLLKGVFTK